MAAPAPRKHTVTVGSLPFEVDTCYTPYKLIGQGAYGLVCAAHSHPSVNPPPSDGEDERDDGEVAIKKISSIFAPNANLIEAKRTLREICLLRHMRHENVLPIRDVLVPSDPLAFSDVYLVFEKMDLDMHRVIQSSQLLSADHVRFFVYQLLRGLKYIHSAGVIHRDLKPGNLLLNANCGLKISDFGLARTVDADAEARLTTYVVTRWYRAPELLMLESSYTAAVDMWSAGCIFAELLRRAPLFKGGSSLDQLQLILSKLPPSKAERDGFDPRLVSAIDTALKMRPLRGADDADNALLKQPPPAQPLRALVPTASEPALDLLAQLLKFDPRKRCTAQQALSHPYLADLHEEAAEPSAPEPVSLDFEADTSLDWKQLRSLYCQIAAESCVVREARVHAYERQQRESGGGTRAAADHTRRERPEPNGAPASASAPQRAVVAEDRRRDGETRADGGREAEGGPDGEHGAPGPAKRARS